ncbi:hypothetical protein ACLKA6_004539 [Drosophila palustris]
MIFWSFTTIVKPILTYASLAWWTKVKQRKAAAELSKLQRLVCVGMTGAMSTCPTDALGIITGISPLPILIEKEACLGALRLQGVANLKSGDLIGHLKVLETFFTSPIVHLSDIQLPSLVFKRNFTVSIYDRSSWNNPNLCIPSGAQVWYTDGSKLENGDTGAGVYGPRFRRFCALEQETSEHVLCECPALCRRRLQILGDDKELLKKKCGDLNNNLDNELSDNSESQGAAESNEDIQNSNLLDGLESRSAAETNVLDQNSNLPDIDISSADLDSFQSDNIMALKIEQPNVENNAEGPSEVPRENASNIDISSANLDSFQSENFMKSLRGTKLRKHLATYTSMLNVKDAQIDRLANFMGHHKDIHKGVNRVPASITEITEVSKMLMAALNNDKESDDDPDQNFEKIDSSEDESALNNPSTKQKRVKKKQKDTVNKDSSDDENALNDHVTKQKRVRKSQKRQRIESTDESDIYIEEKNMSAKKRRNQDDALCIAPQALFGSDYLDIGFNFTGLEASTTFGSATILHMYMYIQPTVICYN